MLLGITIGFGGLLSIIDAMTGGLIPDGAFTGLSVGISVIWSMAANYTYYLKETKGLGGWNPFKGIRMI
ncbi:MULTISPECIES: DUF2628 domain-containing protein [Providencia]|uniref:DUF2628 domain-containing protein n=1 Tax=Providencia TaxID=586 RepID=UPI00029C765A|nr:MULTISPECIES: DUF2628 domain-containing protein [Providencia]EKT58985.1 membrane protein [Providencia rettgeri Dmel1]